MRLERVGAEGTLSFERPRLLPGDGRGRGPASISQMPDLTVSVAAESGPRAYSMAGVRPEDVDVAMLYDAFTINTLLFLGDLGFCEKGEGGAFVSG
jgi:acetyl-CoA acetyltransferase